MMAVGVGNYGNLPIIVISSLCTFERAEPVAYSPVHAHARARPHGVSLTELPSHGQFSGKGSSAHGDTFRPAAEDGCSSNDGFKLNPFITLQQNYTYVCLLNIILYIYIIHFILYIHITFKVLTRTVQSAGSMQRPTKSRTSVPTKV